MATSRPLFVYLQRPDTGMWVTVGRYLAGPAAGTGRFLYAPSYVDAGLAWSIDPVNLPFRDKTEWEATRYGGLHDVLRDATPDAWGQALLRRQHNLTRDATSLDFLRLASNAERWGALAVGASPRASVAHIQSPGLPKLQLLADELAALSAQQPPVNDALRRRLVQTASVGGARPKATVQDEDGQFWIVKPVIATDIADIPLLEHFAQCWGSAAGLHFAESVHHPASEGRSVIRVRRFDRAGEQRNMCVSAASLLQAEYPDNLTETDRWSYPRLAEQLRVAGAPQEDRIELFDRMIFNAVAGNDDDHVRNHAIVFDGAANRWRLAPAFDVVPNPVEMPRTLSMQLSTGRFDISRGAALADAYRFGFANAEAAAAHLDALLAAIERAFTATRRLLPPEWEGLLADRTAAAIALLT